jgi:uncharacterized protein
MEVTNCFLVDSSIERVWQSLLDVPLVVDCFPGASLTETLGQGAYKGLVRVKLGPIAMEFAGAVTLREPSVEDHTATVDATWQETKNRGSASTATKFTLSRGRNAASTQVDVHTTVQLAGQVAQYGRGVGIINAVSEQMVRQFAGKLQDALTSREHAESPSDASAAALSGPTSGEPRACRFEERANELSLFSLLWGTLIAKCRQLFARSHSS